MNYPLVVAADPSPSPKNSGPPMWLVFLGVGIAIYSLARQAIDKRTAERGGREYVRRFEERARAARTR